MLAKRYIIQLRTILSRKGIDEELKEELVHEATNGRTTSIRKMHTAEAIRLINQLNGRPDNYDGKKQRMKRKILALCHEMGWEEPDTGKVDMRRVNAYCKKRGHAHKPFDDYTTAELPLLITQFERLHKSYSKPHERSKIQDHGAG